MLNGRGDRRLDGVISLSGRAERRLCAVYTLLGALSDYAQIVSSGDGLPVQ
jgi:hypothetical protein